jgi:hypothetical protein
VRTSLSVLVIGYLSRAYQVAMPSVFAWLSSVLWKLPMYLAFFMIAADLD